MAANDEMKKIKVYEMFFNIKTDTSVFFLF